MNILQRLWHAHTYEIVEKRSQREKRVGAFVDYDRIYTYVLSRCTDCGKLKHKRIRGEL